MKYIIAKADGTPVDPEAKYFVLRLDKKDRPDNRACRAALQMYCQEVYGIDMEAFEAASNLLAETRTK
jgi:hypothetical protein